MNSPDRDVARGHWQQVSRYGSQPGYPTPNEQRFAAAVAAREAMMAGRPPVAPAVDSSVSRRPWEIVVAAVLGALAPLFVLLALIIAAFTGGRVLRVLGWALHGIGDSTKAAGVSAAGDVTAFLAQVILFAGVAAGVVVMIGFFAYAWRTLVGTGRARWVALACLALGFFVITPLSPLLIGGFLLLGTLSVVFAFLPGSSAWFSQQRRNRAAPGRRERPGGAG